MKYMNTMGMVPYNSPPPQPVNYQSPQSFQQSVPTIATLATQSPLLIGTALSGQPVGYADGGMVMEAAAEMLQDAPPEIMEAVQAFADGKLDADSLIALLTQSGMSPESAQAIVGQLGQVGQMSAGNQVPPQQQQAPPQQVSLDIGSPIEPAVRPKPDRERLYNEGGKVGQAMEMEVGASMDPQIEQMMRTADNPIRSIKKKTKLTRGGQSEESEYTIDFDTAMPPMSQMALDAFDDVEYS